MRIDKLLANMGYGSRKEVKDLLKKGNVRCDDQVVKSPQTHVDPDKSIITVFGETVEYKEVVYLMMNKPPGYVSATEDQRDLTVVDLLEPEDAVLDPFPVGRLDKDTEGLLLITNDGKLAHQLLSPKKYVGKTYYASIDGRVTQEDIEVFQKGVILDDGYVTQPAELKILTRGEMSEIELTITEGKFHQVKRMFESVGKRVTYLKRISMGSLKLDPALQPGEYRDLTEKELDYLQNEHIKK
ncbi:pseudouridine synthase [Sediminibacillus dalangtanensis]|uniref:Pseudouridine synthase n=1 Tax=Sediminibacillus dalangtanensis TaxID=2729421 RepID=A0ABX7VWZ0_9BACI|nr:pseudouridine synthase [Sediminibacillus dalangtanensis]QTN00131.1 pseudouridine synthase [Sediminibacillus dalangtanensis]